MTPPPEPPEPLAEPCAACFVGLAVAAPDASDVEVECHLCGARYAACVGRLPDLAHEAGDSPGDLKRERATP